MQKNHISQNQENLTKKVFGLLPNGAEIFCYRLSNKNGIELDVINYGATIVSLKIPVSKDKKIDVVLGFENLEDYVNSFSLPNAPYFGAVVGRYAGRINNAEFILNGEKIKLTKNHGANQIHGGFEGFSKANWEAIDVKSNAITLQYISKGREENYPGEVTTKITYTITDSNELEVSFMATSTEDTIINLTQHSYFNLDGHAKDIKSQELFVNSDKTLETTSENIPTGKFIALKEHDFNFSIAKKCPITIDNTFVLNQENKLAATLYSKKNNIKMSVFTNQPAVHIYVGGNCFNQIKGKENENYTSLSGICFETQNFPDAPNHSHFPSAILKKNETYLHNTSFKFEI
jgi:aldose 1-epimerase